jgi:hypothetical protein
VKQEAAKVLKAGRYIAEITEAHEATSKAGNPMMVVKLLVEDEDGRQHMMTDYIVATAARLQKLAAATGQDTGEGKEIEAEACVGKTVNVQTYVQEAQGEYGPKAAVKSYSALASGQTSQAPQSATEKQDLPF